MGKRIVSVIAALLLIISDVPFWGGRFSASAADEGTTKDRVINGVGYWDNSQQGIRISLVNKNGEVERTVDIFDFFRPQFDETGKVKKKANGEFVKPGVAEPNLGKTTGYVGDLLNNYSGTFYCNPEPYYIGPYGDIPVEYRIYNKCKIEIAKDNSYNQSDPDTTKMVIANNVSQFEEMRQNEPWYCVDFRTVFRLSNYFKNLDTQKTYDVSFAELAVTNKNEETWINNNIVDRFICEKILGNNRLNIKDFDEDINAWYSLCDILYALGVDIYNDVDINNLDANNRKKLRKNLNNEFLVADYCIVLEPITFVVVFLGSTEKDEEGNYIEKYAAVYYGSATELGMLEADKIVYKNDKGKIEYRSVNLSVAAGTTFTGEPIEKNGFTEDRMGIRLSAWTRNLYQHCLYVTEEREEELNRFSNGTLKAVSGSESWSIVDKKFEMPLYYAHIDGTPKYDWKVPRLSAEWLKTHASGMSIITRQDFIRPQVETFDYNYNADSDVVTSVKVLNGSATDLVSYDEGDDLIKNAAGVPVAMLGKFTVVSVKAEGETNPTGVFVADGSQLTYDFKEKAAELGFATDGSGTPIYEFYGTIDGIPHGESADGSERSAFLSFNWRTPVKPCTITFEAEFLGADGMPEAVNGTSSAGASAVNPANFGHSGPYTPRDTVIETGSHYNTVSPAEDSARSVTYFTCTISDDAQELFFDESAIPPDSVALLRGDASEGASSEEKELLDLNREIYGDYTGKHGFDPAEYTVSYGDPDVFSDRTFEDSVSWTEYTASYDADGNIVLNEVTHTIDPKFKKDGDFSGEGDTDTVFRADQGGLFRDFPEALASGYGTGVEFVSVVGDAPVTKVTVGGKEYENTLVTNFGAGAVLFPEYDYKNYYGRMIPFAVEDAAGSGDRKYMLAANRYSVYYGEEEEETASPSGVRAKADSERAAEEAWDERSRVHFTPVWYPDGKYEIAVYMFDCWTPAGEICTRKTYSIEISGSIYDTWYVTRTETNQSDG